MPSPSYMGKVAVVMQKTTKKCTRIYNARAGLLLSSFDFFCLVTFWLPSSPSGFAWAPLIAMLMFRRRVWFFVWETEISHGTSIIQGTCKNVDWRCLVILFPRDSKLRNRLFTNVALRRGLLTIGQLIYITWLRGIEQKKLIIHPSSSMRFLLFYSPKPRSQVRILIYRNWVIPPAFYIKLRWKEVYF